MRIARTYIYVQSKLWFTYFSGVGDGECWTYFCTEYEAFLSASGTSGVLRLWIVVSRILP